MLSEAMRLHLLALRASIEMVLAADHAEREAARSAPLVECAHPVERRVKRAAMGRENAATCGICGATTEDGKTWTPLAAMEG
jgi:hypothetical protein